MEKGTKVLLFLAAVWVVGACIHFAYGDVKIEHAIEIASDTDKMNWFNQTDSTDTSSIAVCRWFLDVSDDADLENLESKDQYLVCDVIEADLLGCVKISQSVSTLGWLNPSSIKRHTWITRPDDLISFIALRTAVMTSGLLTYVMGCRTASNDKY